MIDDAVGPVGSPQLRSDGRHVYWVSLDNVGAELRRSTGAGAQAFVAQTVSSRFASEGLAYGFLVDEAYSYYWNGGDTLFRQSKDGSGGSEVVANFRDGFWLIGADACFVYGTDAIGSLVRAPRAPIASKAGDGSVGGDAGLFDGVDFLPATDAPGAPGELRYDGFYYDDEPEPATSQRGPYRKAMRFYGDGTVVEWNIWVDPADAELVDESPIGTEGTWTLDGNRIRMTMTSESGNVLYEGEVYQDQLNLRSHSLINQHQDERRFLFEERAAN